MSQPSPAERLCARLEHVPDACREILARLERARAGGGGDVLARLIVDAEGNLEIELPYRYSRRVDLRGNLTKRKGEDRAQPVATTARR